MSRVSVQCIVVLGSLMGFALISGCAGSGEVLNLHVHATPASDAGTAGQEPGQLTVWIQPFDDQRPQREWLGVRTHFWGGRTYFAVEDGQAGDVVARVLADYLEQKGWRVGIGTPDSAQLERNPDATISGKVLEFSAKAKSRFGSTLMTTSLKITLKADNTVNGTSTTMMVDEVREEPVFWFDPEDLEGLVNQTLQESLQRAMVDLKVTDGTLRMK